MSNLQTTDETAAASDVTEARAALAAANDRREEILRRSSTLQTQLGRARAIEFPTTVGGGERGWESSAFERKRAFLEIQYPLEAAHIEAAIESIEQRHFVDMRTYDLRVALFAEQLAAGDADASNLANLGANLRDLAERSKVGDFATIAMAAAARVASYRTSVEALTIRNAKNGDPPPVFVNAEAAWLGVLAVARARTAGVRVTPRDVVSGARGYPVAIPSSVATVEEAVEYLFAPAPPKMPTERLEAERRKLRMLHARAFDVHEEFAAYERDVAEEERRDALTRERAAKTAARVAAEADEAAARRLAEVRARGEAVDEFAESMRRRSAYAGGT